MREFNAGQFMLVTGLVSGISFLFLLTIVRKNYPKSISGTAEWLGSCIAMATTAVFASGALIIVELAEQFFTRVFFLIAMCLILIGLRRFAGQQTYARRLSIIIFALIVLLGMVSTIGKSEKVSILLTMVVAIALAQISLSVSLSLPNRTRPEHCVAFCLFLFIVLYVLRIIFVSFDAVSANFYMDKRVGQTIYVLGFSACFVLLMGSFLLLTAKRLRNTLVMAAAYEDDDVRQRTERWQTGEELRYAIERNELEVYYQPRIDTWSGEVVSVEALLRWKHPVKGNIPPDYFIPIAEESGFIHVLGGWVLKEGVAFAARLRSGRYQVKVSINVSVKQLVSENFAEYVSSTIRDAGVDPGCVELELTESISMGNSEQAIVMLADLRRIGLHLSIDDFGTGYSSLAYLTRLPVTCLKVDRSFVRDIATSKDAKAVIQAIIGMGSALGMRIVAEGVETPAQLNFLRDGGVHEYQGYLFSPPVPECAVWKLIDNAALRLSS